MPSVPCVGPNFDCGVSGEHCVAVEEKTKHSHCYGGYKQRIKFLVVYCSELHMKNTFEKPRTSSTFMES